MNDYIKVDFTFEPVFPLQDIFPQELAELGFETFEETAQGVAAYIPADKYEAGTTQMLVSSFLHSGKIKFTTEIIKAQNWNELWEQSFEPVIVPGKFAICAGFHPQPNVPLVIRVEPKMAFGTGHHPTTFLMASHLIDKDCTGLKILDMGCGTGILAIMAEKKGAMSVLAMDIEEASIVNARENMSLNSCSVIIVEKGSIEQLNNQTFNLILANINRNVLWEHIPVYSDLLEKGGQLWLSGFYSVDVADLKQRINEFDLKVNQIVDLNEWQLMKCQKA